MFSELQHSQRQYFSPEQFCAAFRDWEGQPVNVLQQMDIIITIITYNLIGTIQ